MELRRVLALLLCLPALLAPSGFVGVLCLCTDSAPRARVASCCAEEADETGDSALASTGASSSDRETLATAKRSCCAPDEPPDDRNGELPAHLRAPCNSCHAVSTPDGAATRAPTGAADELARAALCDLSLAIEVEPAAVSHLCAPRFATRAHAPPRTTPLPLRI
jgi:hypothetical protein